MRKTILAAVLAASLGSTASAGCIGPVIMGECHGAWMNDYTGATTYPDNSGVSVPRDMDFGSARIRSGGRIILDDGTTCRIRSGGRIVC